MIILSDMTGRSLRPWFHNTECWDTDLKWFCPIKTDSSCSHNFLTAVKLWKLNLIRKKRVLNPGFWFFSLQQNASGTDVLLQAFLFLLISVNGLTKAFLTACMSQYHLRQSLQDIWIHCITCEKRLHNPEKNTQNQGVRLLCFPHSKSLAQSPNLKHPPWIR